jgi:integrase/recombinase XerD
MYVLRLRRFLVSSKITNEIDLAQPPPDLIDASVNNGSHHTRRAYERIGRRFIKVLATAGTNLRRAGVEDVQSALEAMRTKGDGATSSAATVNTYVAAVKALLGFAHKVGFTRFNAAPLNKLRKAPRKTAQRLLSQVELHLLLRAARTRPDRLMMEVAYFGALRVSELAKPHLVTGDPA